VRIGSVHWTILELVDSRSGVIVSVSPTLNTRPHVEQRLDQESCSGSFRTMSRDDALTWETTPARVTHGTRAPEMRFGCWGRSLS
jgi:hypothetical protein